MVNLLKETEYILKKHRYKLYNIKYVRNAEGLIPVADFVTAARNFNYDNDHGDLCVDPTLVIVGKFWWMTRKSYDGKEWWEFHTKPKKPTVLAVDFMIQNTRVQWINEGPEDELPAGVAPSE